MWSIGSALCPTVKMQYKVAKVSSIFFKDSHVSHTDIAYAPINVKHGRGAGIGWGFDPNRQKIGQMPDPGATKNCQI